MASTPVTGFDSIPRLGTTINSDGPVLVAMHMGIWSTTGFFDRWSPILELRLFSDLLYASRAKYPLCQLGLFNAFNFHKTTFRPYDDYWWFCLVWCNDELHDWDRSLSALLNYLLFRWQYGCPFDLSSSFQYRNVGKTYREVLRSLQSMSRMKF